MLDEDTVKRVGGGWSRPGGFTWMREGASQMWYPETVWSG